MDEEAVIEGFLCKLIGTMYVPYSQQELTGMLLKMRLLAISDGMNAARYRLARSHRFGVAEYNDRKRAVLFEERADELLDGVVRAHEGGWRN